MPQTRIVSRDVSWILIVLVTMWTGSTFINCKTGSADKSSEPESTATAPQQDDPEPEEESSPALPDIPDEDLVLWVRPESLVTERGAVVGWDDVGPHGNHLEAPGVSPRPAHVENGAGEMPAARFDGEDDMLLRDGFSPEQIPAATVFLVATPAANSGEGDGFLSAGQRGDDDYWSGFAVGMGRKTDPDCTAKFPDALHALNTLNAQSRKRDSECGDDLLKADRPFGEPVLISLRLGDRDTMLRFDGAPQNKAAGGGETLHIPQFRLGVRYHHQKCQGFYQGEISEILVYQSALPDSQIEKIEAYLMERYGLGG